MSNGLDPDQDRRSVGPDLDQNSLQRLSADEKRRVSKMPFCIWFVYTTYNTKNYISSSARILVTNLH